MRHLIRRGMVRTGLVGLMLMLAGCFRSGSEQLQPSPIALTRSPVTQIAAVPEVSATTELPTLTPSETLPPGSVATLDLNQIATLPIGLPTIEPLPLFVDEGTPTPTPLPPLSQQSLATAAPLGQTGFLTPRLPMGFLTPDTPAPTPTGPAGLTLQAVPTSTPSGLITPTSLPGVDDPCIYIVESGDSPFAIAQSFEVRLADLLAVNPELDSDNPTIFPGDQLRLPTEGCFEVTPEAVVPINTLTPLIIGTQTGPTVPVGDGIAPTATIDSPFDSPATAAQPAGQQTHTVRSGDTLSTIAAQYGTTIQAIVNANNLSNPNALQIGQQLIIPAGS